MDQPSSPSTEIPSLYVVDGMALLFRSFYAMGRAGLTAPDGTPVGAVYGFLKIIFKLLKECRPHYFVVAWDAPVKTFRHDKFPAYKGTRSPTPEEIVPQIPLIQQVLRDIGIQAFTMPGYEADDIIGTLSAQFASTGCTYIVSSDKDFLQLVGDTTKVVSLKKGDEYEIWGHQHVIDYFGVPPEGVISVLSIMGDAVDNVPGVKGIGEKGAAKLVSEYGSLQGVYDNIDRISNPRTKQLLIDSKESAFLSHWLVTICQTVPIEYELNSLRLDFDFLMSKPETRTVLSELRMASLLKTITAPQIEKLARENKKNGESNKNGENEKNRESNKNGENKKNKAANAVGSPQDQIVDIFGNTVAAASIQPIHKLQIDRESGEWGIRNYHLVDSVEKLQAICQRITSPLTQIFAFDTETTGLDILEDRPIGFSICFESGEAHYIPACDAHLNGGALCGREAILLDPIQTWAKLAEAFKNRKSAAVAHNLKFDMHQLLNVGVTLGDAPLFCSMVGAWLCDPVAGGYGLDEQTWRKEGLVKIPTSTLIGKKIGRGTMLEVPLAQICEYACEDVDATFRIWNKIEKEIAEKSLQNLYYELEMPILSVLVDMERAGVHVDHNQLLQLSDEIHSRLMEIEQQIFIAAGETFNIASPKQLGAVLFERLKVQDELGFKGKMAKTTLGFKTDAAVLEQFEAHPVVALIQEFRELSKLLNTYIIVLPQLIKKCSGRIHTHFNQIGTATGRLSSNDPNLQNIPIRTVWGKKVRAAFSTPSPNRAIISADYSQIELRVLAHLSSDPVMIDAFKKGADIHRETAAKILGKEPAEVTSEERSNAKTINFGIIYGMGPQRLAKEQGITLQAAKSFIERYFMNFAKVREYLDNKRIEAHETGMVKTLFGRPRPLPQLRAGSGLDQRGAENMAINSPIQGTAADVMKFGMLRVHQALKHNGFQTRMVLQVHDELVLEGPVSEVDAVCALMHEALEGAVQFSVPLLTDVSSGSNWLNAKK